jgi:hypothetical protein
MNTHPKIIALDQIAGVIAEKFKTKDEITCYVGSNAATPTASLITAGWAASRILSGR